MNPTKSDIRKWCQALRSGKYKQGKLQLETPSGRFCCLGVACKVFIPLDKQILFPDMTHLLGIFPRSQDACPHWLGDMVLEFRIKTGKSITSLNDSEGFTFDEIADILEAVYIHEVLE